MAERLRTLVIGLGVQGAKRRLHAGADYVGAVDPTRAGAEWRDLAQVPLDAFDAAILCTPDSPKLELLHYLLANGKHALVEKPLWAEEASAIPALEALARGRRVALRTAYNHRYEPHFLRLRHLIQGGELGRVYRCRLFYGNGTARLARDSDWRDRGSGVLHDLGSHLLDAALFWFGAPLERITALSADRFENRAPDHVVLGGRLGEIRFEAEMTLLSWRNHFTADVLAEAGSAHIESLCKWGPSRFITRRRLLPSGRPPEESVTLTQEDPTWAAEYQDFRRFAAEVEAGRAVTTLTQDMTLDAALRRLSAEVVALVDAR